MAKITTLEAVKNKMKELQEARQAQFDKIRQMQETYRAQISDADRTMKQATAELDLDAYDTARQARRRAMSGLEMYDKREKELWAQEIISEPESDRIIDDLLRYEEELAADFRTAIEKPIRQLSQIHAKYMAELNDTENTLEAWQQDIHANYTTRGKTIYTDPATGKTTDRSKTPVPVHVTRNEGCAEAAQLEQYLKKSESGKVCF